MLTVLGIIGILLAVGVPSKMVIRFRGQLCALAHVLTALLKALSAMTM